MLNGTLHLAKSDGSFVRRTFDGSSFGGEVPVNTHDLLAPLTAWQDDIRSMTSLFYDSGRIYFTRAGSDTLYYRYFTDRRATSWAPSATSPPRGSPGST